MRALVVADIHANLGAFEAVLRDAEDMGPIDTLWCLGDVVGYGAEPEACIELLRGYPLIAVAGNHDLAVLDLSMTSEFNAYAAEAIRWTAGRLNAESKQWLRALPQVVLVEEEFTLTHGSLVDPIWCYLVTNRDAEEHLKLQATPYGFVGHSHLPLVFVDRDGGEFVGDDALALDGPRLVANPGSVGQPRDGDPRAAYAIVDTDARRMSLHRVDYDIEDAQRKILEAGLPQFLAVRLAAGR
jgi:diadenosine tetraphosphatase ApaH/serine/threonine PP2A family protein phosphatase